jgi:hypothetical protein
MSELERPFLPMSWELGGDFMSGMADSIRERGAREVPGWEGVTADELARMGVRLLRIGNVRVYEKPPCAVLVRGVPFPCPHRDENGDYVEHLSYHVTHARASRQEYEKVAEWLEWGFWSDAAVRHTAETERRLVMDVLG